MNCSIIHKAGILFMTAMVFAINGIFAQCGFQSAHASGCKGFPLNLTDTTTGRTHTCWFVRLPQGSIPANDTLCNSQQFSLNTGLPGVRPGTVIVTMTDSVGGQICTHTDSNFHIYPFPVINGTFSTTVTCTGACVYWHDSSSAGRGCTLDSFLMDWGNSAPFQTVRVPSQCETYNTNGSYHPSIILINSCGCRAYSVVADSIVVTAPPSASFSGPSLYSCTSPFTTTLTAASNAPNTRYSWYVDTSGRAFSSTPKQATGSNTFIHSYPAGTWNVKLVVLDTLSGCTDSIIQTNYVSAGNNPAACFTILNNDTNGCWGMRTFCPCPSDTIATTYQWDFFGAPGTYNPAFPVTNRSPACMNATFFAAGYYQARMIVSYPGGCYDTMTETNLHFGTQTPLRFSTPDTVFCSIPVTTCMTYTGSPCLGCSFQWYPPGSSTPTLPTGTCYTLTSYQLFSPELIVTDAAGCPSVLVKNFYITDMPLNIIVNKTYAHGDGCINDTIILNNSNSSGGPYSSVIWSFPGAHLISQNGTIAKVSYSSTGCHPYSLIMRSMTGCADTLRDSICIQPKPVVTMRIGPHDLCYEKKANIFYVDTLPPNPNPNSVQVWPEGIKPGGGPIFTIPSTNFDSFPYIYQDYGTFAFCFLANNGGCLGDTTCLTAPADSVHIFPPIPAFSMVSNCTSTLTRVLTNTSKGQDSISWSFNNVHYPTQGNLTVTFPQCGIKYPISITAFHDTTFSYMENGILIHDTGCWLTKSDSISAPCYETDFKFDITKGCIYVYSSQAGIYFTGPNPYRPTQVKWSLQTVGSPPVFGCCPSGDTVNYYQFSPGQYNACVQLTYPNGCIDTMCKPKYIDVSYPIPAYTIPNTTGCIPFSVHFTNTSTVRSGAIAHFYWSFGDGIMDSVDFNPTHIYTISGQFQACLEIVDTNGCTNYYCRQIQADNIQANFMETDSITCLKNSSPLNPITYMNTSTGMVDSLIWLLPAALGPVPDSIVGNQSSITEQYTVQGSGSIGLVAMDLNGICRDTIWKPIRVANPIANYGLPNAGDTFFSCPPVPLCLIDSSKNDICTWNYILGDGFTDTAQNPCHIWQYAGTYPITQIVTSCHGCADTTIRDTIRISGATVSTSVNKTGGCPCTTITWTFTTIGTDTLFFTSDGGNPLFEDIAIRTIGTPSRPTDTTISVIYCNTGNIQPIMSAHSPGCSQVVFPITPVFIDSPNTAFSHSLGGCGSDSVCFTNLTTFNAPQAFDSINYWNFGDGSTKDTTLLNPCHHFPGPGDYTVTLTVKDQLLCSSSWSTVVHIPAHPHAAFMVDDSVGCLPFLVHFTDSSHVDTGTTMTGYWSFGDGTIANTTADTFHTYTTVHLDTATLVITDGYGCTDSVKHTIQVSGPANIVMGPDQTICLGDTANLSVSGGAVYHWSPNYNIDNPTSATPRVWPAIDTYYIVKIGTAALCVEYDTVHIKVVHFTVSLDTAFNVCGNQLTTLSASAQVTHDSIISYSWTFGDGSPSVSDSTVTHQYAIFGTYSDTLIVTSLLGCRDTVVHPVTIFDIPHAAFSLSGDTVCVGVPATATNLSTPGSGALAGFTFYTPAVSTTSPDTFVPTTPGLGTVILIQTDINQCADTVSQSIFVFTPPATFNIDTFICPGDTITLSAGGGANAALWMPNYNISNTSSLTPQVWPAVDTPYYFRLGSLAQCYVYDTVNVLLSTITVTADTALPACLGLPSTFTASATAVNATISSYNWNFGDGTGLRGDTVSHIYTTYGTHHDTLIMVSSRGCHDTAYSSATVNDTPHAALSVSLDSVCIGVPFTVTNLSTPGASGGLSTFYFNFGFPPNGTTSPATFTYYTAGNQTIGLVQSDINQCKDSATGHIFVHNLPVANFTYDTSCIKINNPYISTSTIGDGPITTYSWTVNGLPESGNTDSINYTFQTPGAQTICLGVLDKFGCQRDTCQNVIIVSPAMFTVAYDATICAGSSDTVSITGLVSGAQWVPVTWVSDPNSPNTVITPLQTISYLVTVYYRNCIPVVDTVGIWVIDSVPVSASANPVNITLGLTSNVTTTVRGTIDSIIWSPDTSLDCRNCMNPIASPQQTTTYTATIYYSKNGVVCSNTATVTVTVFRSCEGSLIYVPNTFTPNGDGVDDVFKLQRGQGITMVEYFRVYDQWGKKVYEAENVEDPYNAAWNGGLNNDNLNKPMNTGVYVYEFQIKCITGQTVAGKGNITLLR